MEREQRRAATLTMNADGEAAAATSYNRLLGADPGLAEQTYRRLTEAQHADGLLMPGRLLCNVLRPRFLSRTQRDDLAPVSRVLAGIFERAGTHLLASDRLLDLIGASEEERAAWAVDPGYPGFTLTSRLDSFMVDGRPHFVEYNAESPAGIGYTDALSEVFAALPAMQHWEQEYGPTADRTESDANPAVERFHGRQRLLETLLWAYQAWGGRQAPPQVAIVDWGDVITRRDFELCGEHFRQHGIPVIICDPRAFEYRQGALYHGEQRIDLVYRRVLLHELLAKAAEAHALLQAYCDGAICMVNSPRSKLLHKKAVFALLSDRRLGLSLSEDEQRLVEATIPWTRLLRQGETEYGGRQVDLIPFLLAGQERFVLKPVDEYGGRGVVLGWETSREEWERALEDNVDGDYVVQERVAVPEEDFPAWEDGRLTLIPLLVDTDPLLFRGEMGSVVTRISGSSLLNVSAGSGSTTPTFIASV